VEFRFHLFNHLLSV